MTTHPVTQQHITKAGFRYYSDSGQTIAFVEWANGSETTGNPSSAHMQALLSRASLEVEQQRDELLSAAKRVLSVVYADPKQLDNAIAELSARCNSIEGQLTNERKTNQ